MQPVPPVNNLFDSATRALRVPRAKTQLWSVHTMRFSHSELVLYLHSLGLSEHQLVKPCPLKIWIISRSPGDIASHYRTALHVHLLLEFIAHCENSDSYPNLIYGKFLDIAILHMKYVPGHRVKVLGALHSWSWKLNSFLQRKLHRGIKHCSCNEYKLQTFPSVPCFCGQKCITARINKTIKGHLSRTSKSQQTFGSHPWTLCQGPAPMFCNNRHKRTKSFLKFIVKIYKKKKKMLEKSHRLLLRKGGLRSEKLHYPITPNLQEFKNI